ncbi:MAG: phosphonate ABC transporter, permease protein PhnE [Burkholderiaceae bacterium]|nr:phosphonate ABC transporter, permease protein PhnE [Burkholderiaceae bacterium]
MSGAASRPLPRPPLRWASLAWGLALAVLVLASFASLDLQWAQFLAPDALASMARFAAEFYPPDLGADFAWQTVHAGLETLAMSCLGTLLAAAAGLVLALGAARPPGAMQSGAALGLRRPLLWLMNLLRAIPELVWAALLLILAGLGPMSGTLALALHTSGVLGRLFAQALENAPPEPDLALRLQGVGRWRRLAFAGLPLLAPQLLSYTLYRWENNIRAAAVLGVVGAGGLGQSLSFHMGLFHMGKTATVLLAMLALVALVDGLSAWLRRLLTR